MYTFDQKTGQIVISGWENGVANSPYEGIADMRNADITSVRGEVSVAFRGGAVTLPPALDAEAYTAAASTDRLTIADASGLYENCAIVLASNTATGLSNGVVYYVRNITGNTFQVSTGPNRPVVDISGDGGGTLTTYQYGNQRGLTDNGAPVSYYEAPEMGGVLLCDSSNYAWLWQQGDDGLSPFNTLLFLGNIGGIGAASGNQTGIAYWNNYVVLVQQPATINVLNWVQFSSPDGSDWNYTNTQHIETVPLSVTLDTAVASIGTMMRLSSSNGLLPQYLASTRTFAAGSDTTITSDAIAVETGDVVVAVIATWNNQLPSSATYNGNAMTAITGFNDTSPFNFGFRVFLYEAPSAMSGTVVGSYGAGVTNRMVSVAIMRNASTTSPILGSFTNTSSTTVSSNMPRISPNQIGFLWFMSNNDTDLDNTTELQQIVGGLNSGTGQDWLYLYSQGHGSSVTLKKNVPITVGEDDALYYGSGEQFVASLIENAGETFDPTDTDTFVLNWQALDLPEDEIVQSLEMTSGLLFCGGLTKKVYPWDTISPSFDYPIVVPEAGITDFVASNQLLYTFAGSLGKIYLTNTSNSQLHRELPDQITAINKPYYFFWDANVERGELYFAFQGFPNDSDTPLTTLAGAWALNADTGALRLVQQPVEGYNAWTRMVCPVGNGQNTTFMRPPGQGILLGYSVGSDYYLDYSESEPYTNWETVIETEIIPVATYFDKHTFEHIEYKLGAPMVDGEGIRVYQRSNLSDSYELIAEFTTSGLISDQASINWEDVEWVQFKIELKSTDVAFNPSYVRLRELRIR